MRIAMISEHASPLAAVGGIDAGGQNIYVAHVARCLAERGHQVDVFTRRDEEALLPVVEVQPGFRVVHVTAGPQAPVPKELLLDQMPAFARFCQAWFETAPRYDVIHANFFMSGWVGLQLKQWFGVPLVTTFHALGLVRMAHQKEADAFPPARVAIERAVVEASDCVIAECPQDQIDLESLYGADPQRIANVPCGVDTNAFTPFDRSHARERLGLAPDAFMVLQVGRMVPRKGVETVVQAMAQAPCKGMQLHIVGGECEVPDPVRTPEIGRLQRAAQGCGVSHKVTFAGCKPRAELPLWYAASDVFVTVPWYEPFGITPLEAMACARPVVGSAVGGVQFTIRHGVTGLLVPPKDPAALAKALAALRADPTRARAMGQAGLQRARTEFTWHGVASRLAAVFEAAAARTQATAPICHIVGHDVSRPPRRTGAGARPAVFLDKDGTLVHDVPYNVDLSQVRFTPHAFDALKLWQAAGHALVVVTNQPGLAQRRFDRPALECVFRSMAERLGREGIAIDGFFVCPHDAGDGCACRKPGPGMLFAAARELDIDLSRSWMVGDILNDVEAGHRAGCSTVLLDVGNETDWVGGLYRIPGIRCADLLEAAHATLACHPLDPPSSGRMPFAADGIPASLAAA